MILPPVKDIKRSAIGLNLNQFAPKQIFINFTGKKEMPASPKHIRVSQQRHESELRYSTRSQLSSLDSKKVKQLKLFNPPLNMEKDYLSKKIKRTVKHYFNIRKSSIDTYLTRDDFLKDKDIKHDGSQSKETEKEREKNTFFQLELDIDNKRENESDKDKFHTIYGINNSPKSTDKSFMVVNFHNNQEFLDIRKDVVGNECNNSKEIKKLQMGHRNSRKRISRMIKIDQSLQTDENLLNRNSQGIEHN